MLATDLDAVDNEDSLEILKEITLLIVEPLVKVLSVRPEDTELSSSERTERHALLSLLRLHKVKSFFSLPFSSFAILILLLFTLFDAFHAFHCHAM